jgi:hypothetical protein
MSRLTEQKHAPSGIVDEAAAGDGVRFARFWAVGLMLLILATAPLWGLRWSDRSDLPAIAWLPGGERIGAVDPCWTALVLFTLALVALDIKRRVAWSAAGLGLGLLVLLDQHRLQPWVYQSLAYAGVFAVLPWREGRRWVTAITVSIYAYSAVGKFDYQFVHTVGRDFVDVLSAPVGGLQETSAVRAAFLMPIGELAAAVLIAVPATRRIGGVLAITMHAALMILLGPWLLDHSWGVLCWNAVLAVQGYLLFVKPPDARPSPDKGSPRWERTARGFRWPLRVALLGMLIAPLFERHGYWDHWTSWALYSPHNSRAEIQLHQSAFARLPEDLQPYLRGGAEADRWYDLDIESWSLQRRWVPVYPQARYQLRIAQQLAEGFDLGPAIRVRVKGVADRWTGRRESKDLVGSPRILAADADFGDADSRW